MAAKKKQVLDKSKVSLDDFLKKAKKDYGGDTVGFTEEICFDGEQISTTSFELDKALNGGWWKGRIHELWGYEASGKTLLTLLAIAECQRNGDVAALIDAEQAFDKEFARNFGVDTDSLIVVSPDHGQQALDILEDLLRVENMGLIVVDSVSALVPKEEAEAGNESNSVGLQARMMGQALRKLTPRVKKTNVAVIFINQIREKVGQMFGNPETTSGGNALKFYASVRIEVRFVYNKETTNPIFDDDGKQIGHVMSVRIVKSKVSAKSQESIILPIYYYRNPNIDNETPKIMSVVSRAVHLGHLEQSGSWYKYPGEKNFANGTKQVVEYFQANPEDYAELEEKQKGAKDIA